MSELQPKTILESIEAQQIKSVIKSIQRGSVGASELTTSPRKISISPVNMEKSILIVHDIYLGTGFSSQTPLSPTGEITLYSSNEIMQVHCQRVSNYYFLAFEWQVIEFY